MWRHAEAGLVPPKRLLETPFFILPLAVPGPKSHPMASGNYHSVCAVTAPAGMRQRESVSCPGGWTGCHEVA